MNFVGNAFYYQTGAVRSGAQHDAGMLLPGQRLQETLDLTVDYYWEQDLGFRFTYVHLATALALSEKPEHYLGSCFWELRGMPPASAPEWQQFRHMCAKGQSLRQMVVERRLDDDDVRHACIDGNPVLDPHGSLVGYRGVVRDVTDQRRLEDQASTFDLSPIGIAHVSLTGHLLHVNAKFCDMLGYTPDQLVGRAVRDISHPEDADMTSTLAAQMHSGEIPSFKMEKRYLRSDGSALWVGLSSTLKYDQYGKPLHDITIVEDISGRRHAEEQARFLATHDSLTGLANRTLFSQLLAFAAASGRRYGRRFAVITIALDRFKQINEAFGPVVGDDVLREIGSRLAQTLRASDVVARLGGDEFAVLLEEAGTHETLTGIARNLLHCVSQPLRAGGRDCHITASLGVSRFPEDGTDEQTILKKADVALFNAKEEGGNGIQFYQDGRRGLKGEQLAMEHALRGAIEAQELSLHYQPKVQTITGKVCGVEALLRWNSAELGPVSPADFIPVAEESGLIIPIGRWVLEQACVQLRQWHLAGLPGITVAVNLSPRQFADPDLIPGIEALLRDTQLDPELLELEVTESTVMHNAERAQEQLKAISNLGIRLAIDDFGTGYSSLAKLKTFPLTTLKIDRAFIRDIETDEEDRILTETIIRMGKTLGLEVVAEGVETAEQLALLAGQGCDVIQGYYYSKPLPPPLLEEFLRKRGGC